MHPRRPGSHHRGGSDEVAILSHVLRVVARSTVPSRPFTAVDISQRHRHAGREKKNAFLRGSPRANAPLKPPSETRAHGALAESQKRRVRVVVGVLTEVVSRERRGRPHRLRRGRTRDDGNHVRPTASDCDVCARNRFERFAASLSSRPLGRAAGRMPTKTNNKT